MSLEPHSPESLAAVFDALRGVNAEWYVEFGEQQGEGWIPGAALRDAERGPFNALLLRIAARMRCDDRKIVAACFALKFGWAASAAIGPYVLHDTVPSFALENVSLRFNADTFFERLALHRQEAVKLCAGAPFDALTRRLRRELVAQAEPVVEALHAWSRFSRRGIWGQITSSWGAHIANILAEAGRAEDSLSRATQFFAAKGVACEMAPDFYPIHAGGKTRVFHRRASCCLFYHLPDCGYCASCPLISAEESRARQAAFLEKTVREGTA